MAAAPAVCAVASDFFLCAGLGCLLCAVRGLAGLIFGEGPVRRFALDLASFAAAAVLVCGFSAGVSATGLARWYMAAGLLCGALAWRTAAAPTLRRMALAGARAAFWPFAALHAAVSVPLQRRVRERRRAHRARRLYKKRQKKQKSGKKQLPNTGKVLYN